MSYFPISSPINYLYKGWVYVLLPTQPPKVSPSSIYPPNLFFCKGISINTPIYTHKGINIPPILFHVKKPPYAWEGSLLHTKDRGAECAVGATPRVIR